MWDLGLGGKDGSLVFFWSFELYESPPQPELAVTDDQPFCTNTVRIL